MNTKITLQIHRLINLRSPQMKVGRFDLFKGGVALFWIIGCGFSAYKMWNPMYPLLGVFSGVFLGGFCLLAIYNMPSERRQKDE